MENNSISIIFPCKNILYTLCYIDISLQYKTHKILVYKTIVIRWTYMEKYCRRQVYGIVEASWTVHSRAANCRNKLHEIRNIVIPSWWIGFNLFGVIMCIARDRGGYYRIQRFVCWSQIRTKRMEKIENKHLICAFRGVQDVRYEMVYYIFQFSYFIFIFELYGIIARWNFTKSFTNNVEYQAFFWFSQRK